MNEDSQVILSQNEETNGSNFEIKQQIKDLQKSRSPQLMSSSSSNNNCGISMLQQSQQLPNLNSLKPPGPLSKGLSFRGAKNQTRNSMLTSPKITPNYGQKAFITSFNQTANRSSNTRSATRMAQLPTSASNQVRTLGPSFKEGRYDPFIPGKTISNQLQLKFQQSADPTPTMAEEGFSSSFSKQTSSSKRL